MLNLGRLYEQNREKVFYTSNSLMHARTVLGGAVGDMIPSASSGSSIVCGYRDTTGGRGRRDKFSFRCMKFVFHSCYL